MCTKFRSAFTRYQICPFLVYLNIIDFDAFGFSFLGCFGRACDLNVF